MNLVVGNMYRFLPVSHERVPRITLWESNSPDNANVIHHFKDPVIFQIIEIDKRSGLGTGYWIKILSGLHLGWIGISESRIKDYFEEVTSATETKEEESEST